MDDVPLQQMPVKLFIHRLHIIHAAFDDPVGQCRPGELHSQLFPVRLLAVKRDAVHIFLVHHVSNRGRRCEAVLQQRAWCFSPNDNGSAVFLAFRTAKDFLDILDPFHFCRDDPQFFPYDLFPDDFHESITVGTVSVLIRYRTWNFDYKQPCKDLFPGGLRFLCLTIITSNSLFQSRFRDRRIRSGFCLIEQLHLSGKCILFCFFTGRCEQLFLQIFDCFIEICDRLVQLCGLFLMAFGHLLDRKALAVYQLTQGFNCLFLKLYERFHF